MLNYEGGFISIDNYVIKIDSVDAYKGRLLSRDGMNLYYIDFIINGKETTISLDSLDKFNNVIRELDKIFNPRELD